jgi:peptidylprolyl isomerase
LLALGALAAACGSGGSSSEEDSAPGPPEPRETKIVRSDSLRALGVGRQVSEKPQFGTPAGRPSPDLLVYDVIEGDGAEATAGRPLSMHYVGKSLSTGEEFDASWDRGEPFSFTLGGGEVIPGWDIGVEGMREGGRRVLVIPPGLAYGAEGSPPAIKPGETLVFVVDLERVGR